MPMYDYSCAACGDFSAQRRISERNEPLACPLCGKASARREVSAPALAQMDAATRQAHQRNEQASWEPKQSSKGHGAGCSCCSGGKRSSRTVQAADGSRSFARSRPWMISH